MQSDQPDPETMLPLTPAVFNILLALADGERHGYSIMQEITGQTQGKLWIGPTTLYRSIKHMLEDGLISRLEQTLAVARSKPLLGSLGPSSTGKGV